MSLRPLVFVSEVERTTGSGAGLSSSPAPSLGQNVPGLAAAEFAERLHMPGFAKVSACTHLLDELVAQGLALESAGTYHLTRRAECEFGQALRNLRSA